MFESLNNLDIILDVLLNVLETIAIVISIVTFFFLMFNKYNKALKKILGPCGMAFGARIKVLFLCRKSQAKKRAFIEYAILQTGGCPVIASEWSTIINNFKAFYAEGDQETLRYDLPNCTPLIEKDFSDATRRYFRYFSEKDVRKTFGIQDEAIRWVIRLHIEEAYATPTCLLTGLLSQYDESWEEFIKRYVSTAYIGEGGELKSENVLSNELYFTFAWLLWGPSYQLKYQNSWAGLCQLSYGDESNSIPAIADTRTEVGNLIRNKFIENDERRYGALISVDVSLLDKKPFYASLRAEINPDNAYFYDKVESGDLSFGIRIDSFAPCMNYKSKKYYSTAYAWILFELETEGYAFRPETSVAFFEHVNLADRETYRFLVETLIEKSLKHFRETLSDPETADRKYRFVCAMNDTIAEECVAKYREIMASDTDFGRLLAEHIILEQKHNPAEVFSAYDEFFSPSGLAEFVEVDLDDRRTISDFGRFYTEIYMDAFKDEDEREGFNNFLKYLSNAKTAVDYKYHVILAKDVEGRIIGGCVFDYFPKSNTGVIEFIAVRSDLQSGGVGSLIYKKIRAILSEDAFQMTGGPLDYICCEIDSPEYSKAEIKKYLYFWNKNNFRHLDFHYVQPALSSDQKPVEGLWFTISPQRAECTEISSRLVADVVSDYLKYAMGIEDPSENETYRAMERELLANEEVPTSPIIE